MFNDFLPVFGETFVQPLAFFLSPIVLSSFSLLLLSVFKIHRVDYKEYVWGSGIALTGMPYTPIAARDYRKGFFLGVVFRWSTKFNVKPAALPFYPMYCQSVFSLHLVSLLRFDRVPRIVEQTTVSDTAE